ncbi:MAG: hypothetical protein UR54_C0001G0002 [Candidatus Roizmanbacteria bacterium GW2011_GWA2_34_18]|uniref:Uncharacterized protein n=1 Tax=Candidatus Roizmanbacteria bacterium GW2011_GWA2_34_18 TaxID=1618477 RepID=A0A0G0E224_9BACT|nr:MAG: hypothetical protein UR54_C0001G0002 [Candidatus Roizmanbacteria bacterium GW2011_GWA2_34_18]
MITDADIKKMGKVFATKDELAETTKELIKLIYSVKSELKADIVDFKDSILTEIIKLREDITVVIGYSDRIEDHDQRIEKLETTVYQ